MADQILTPDQIYDIVKAYWPGEEGRILQLLGVQAPRLRADLAADGGQIVGIDPPPGYTATTLNELLAEIAANGSIGPQGPQGPQGIQGPPGPAPVWGNITGTLPNQTDLQAALNGKENVGAAASAVAAHVALADPHPQYLTPTEAGALYQPLDPQLTSLAALTFSGNATRFVRLNAAGDNFEFVDAPSGGGGGATNYVLSTSGSTLTTTPVLAVLAASATYPLPASPNVGDVFTLRNFSGNGAAVLATADPGPSRTIVYGDGRTLALGEVLSCRRGEEISLVCRSASVFELRSPGAVGPIGPIGPPGTTDHGLLVGLADDDHPQYLNNARGDLRYDPLGASTAQRAAHEAAADPHPQYLTPAEASAAYAPLAHVGGGGTAHANAVAGGNAGFMSGADKTKLDGIAAGATANATDAALRDRATHTGTQVASTISDFAAESRAQAEAFLVAGTNVTITYSGSGATRTATINATGGGGGGTWGSITGTLSNQTDLQAALDAKLDDSQIGTSGATIPLLNAVNTWSAGQDFSAAIVVAFQAGVYGSAGTNRVFDLYTGATAASISLRWRMFADNSAESGANAGSNFALNRYSDAGVFLSTVLNISRSTGALTYNHAATVQSLTIGTNATAAVQPGTSTGQTAIWNQAAGRYEPGAAGAAGAGGTNTQVQFNNGGVLAGATGVTVESNRLVHADYEEFALQSAAVSTPAAGRVRIYGRQRAGRAFLDWVGPSGVDITAQPAFFNNRIMLIAPNTTTSVTATGINATTAATLSHPTLSSASLAQSIYRTRCQTSATAGNAAGIRHGSATMLRGNATALGGFYFHARVCSGALALAGGEAFIGLSSSTAALAGAPSALADAIGLVKDVADTAWQFTRRTGTGTVQKVALTTPLTYAANQVIDVILFSRPGGTGIGCVVRSFNNAGVPTTHLDTQYTTDIPAVTTFLAGRFDIRNGATAAAADFELVRMYAESDF